jgi:hypothetical protein
MTAKLTQLAERVYAAHKALHEEFEREFPVGTHICWMYRGTHQQAGTIEYNRQFGTRMPEMRVMNERTGKLVWVSLSMRPRRAPASGR